MNINENETIFPEKFRPFVLDDIILTESQKERIKEWKENKDIPNLLLVSRSPGLGKSSLAHVLINEFQADVLFLNISLFNNIDTLRTKIKNFVTTVGFSDQIGTKFVVLDEADGMSQMLQNALRGFIEEYSSNARFILTANYKEKLIEPLIDRLQVIDFDLMFKEHKSELIKATAKRLIDILKYLGVKYNKDDVIKLVKGTYPSNRKLMVKLQESIYQGTLIINEKDNEFVLKNVYDSILDKNFERFRVSLENITDPGVLYDYVYKHIEDFDIKIRPKITILTARYAYQDSFSRDRVVNTAAFGAEMIILLKGNE